MHKKQPLWGQWRFWDSHLDVKKNIISIIVQDYLRLLFNFDKMLLCVHTEVAGATNSKLSERIKNEHNNNRNEDSINNNNIIVIN